VDHYLSQEFVRSAATDRWNPGLGDRYFRFCLRSYPRRASSARKAAEARRFRIATAAIPTAAPMPLEPSRAVISCMRSTGFRSIRPIAIRTPRSIPKIRPDVYRQLRGGITILKRFGAPGETRLGTRTYETSGPFLLARKMGPLECCFSVLARNHRNAGFNAKPKASLQPNAFLSPRGRVCECVRSHPRSTYRSVSCRSSRGFVSSCS